jgi:hypothetical protein
VARPGGLRERPGELRTAADALRTTADPSNTDGDRLPWNWRRMPAGISYAVPSPATVAVIPGVVAHLSQWLGRDVVAQPTGHSAPDALIGALRG